MLVSSVRITAAFAAIFAMVASFLVAGATKSEALPGPTPIGQQITDGPNGVVRAVAVGADGTQYLGGDFTAWGPQTGGGAVVIGATAGVNRSFPRIDNGEVLAVAADGVGGYYIGGTFTSVAGQPRNHAAHVLATGQLNQEWNPSPNAAVRALAVSGTTVFLGGDFTQLGGSTRNYVAAVNANGTINETWTPSLDNAVNALVVDGDKVYIGGKFLNVNDVQRRKAAAVSTDGILDPTWNPNLDGEVKALLVSGSKVYIGGSFGYAGSAPRSKAAAVGVDGILDPSWTPESNQDVNALAVSGSTIYVGGRFSNVSGVLRANLAAIEADGQVNQTWDPSPQGEVTSLAMSGSTLYLGGYFLTVAGSPRTRAAAVDATSGALNATWNPSATGAGSPSVKALAVSGSTVYLGGDFSMVGAQSRNRAAAVNADGTLNTTWNPNLNATVYALAVSGSTVYLGGDFSRVGGQTRNRAAAVDATDGSLNTSWAPNPNGAVYALAVSDSTVYLGGDFSSAGGQARSNAAAVNTTDGSATGWAPNPDGEVNALAVSGSTVYLGGGFSSAGGQARSNAAAVNTDGTLNTSWLPNPNGTVNALAVSGSTVYIGGNFGRAGNQMRKFAAAVNATDGLATGWNPDPDVTVSALAVSGSTVYLGGYFETVGGTPRNRAAAVNATDGSLNTSWAPEPNGTVLALAVSGSTVYLGGSFTGMASPNYTASGLSTGYFAGLAGAGLVPGAPTGVAIVSDSVTSVGGTSVVVGFTAPSVTGGSAISSYNFQTATSVDGYATWSDVDSENVSCEAGPVSPCTVSGLTDGVQYRVRVQGVNGQGAGAWSAASQWFVPQAAEQRPSVPTDLAGVAGDQLITATWTRSVSAGAGASAVNRYRVFAFDGATMVRICQSTGATTESTQNTCAVTNLTNGTAYRLRARSFNNLNVWSDLTGVTESSFIPAVAAAAPTSLVATPGDGSVSIAFTAGADGGSPITNYEYQLDGGSWTALSPAATASPVTISGLTNGQVYSVKLRAVTGVGAGAESGGVNVTPAAAAAAPSSLVATPGDGSVLIAFTAGSNGGSPITNYEYQLDGGSWTALSPAATASPVTISGLTNGQVYSIKLRAVTAVGAGAVSDAVSVTPRTTPSAPSGLVATPGNGSASIAFTAGIDGGSPITNYEYQLDGGSWTALSPAATTSPVTITGLTNLQTYSIKLRAVNAAGVGAASAGVNVTPVAKAAAPTSLVATPGNGSASIAFTAGSNGGSPITNYEYQLDGGLWTALSPAATTSPVTITGLTNGQVYSVKLRAVTAAGAGAESDAVSVTPSLPPAAPGSVVGIAGNGSVSLWFTAGASGGAPITNYEYQIGSGSWTALSPADDASPVTITGLSNGSPVSIKIRAVNAAGPGAASDSVVVTPTSVMGTMSNPDFLPVTQTEGQAPQSVSGNTAGLPRTLDPRNSPNQLVTGRWYKFTATATKTVGLYTSSVSTDNKISVYQGNPAAGGTWIATDDDSGPGTGAALTWAATTGVEYYVLVRYYGYTDVTMTYTLLSGMYASSPSNLTASPGNESASVSFAPPAFGATELSAEAWGNLAVTNYEYQVSTDGGSTYGSWTALSPADTTTPVTVPGLTGGVVSYIKLRAVSGNGAGAASVGVAVTPTRTVGRMSNPEPLTVTQTEGQAAATVSVNSLGLGWTTDPGYDPSLLYTGVWYSFTPSVSKTVGLFTTVTSEDNYISVYSGYPTSGNRVAFNDDSGVGTGAAVTWPASQGTTYYVLVRRFHAGLAANFTSTVLSGMYPDAPTALTATAGNGSASIAFTPPDFGTYGELGSSGWGNLWVTNYQYALSTDGGSSYGSWTALSPADVTSPVTIPGLTNGQTYTIKLRAVSANGAGAQSAAVTVTPSQAAAMVVSQVPPEWPSLRASTLPSANAALPAGSSGAFTSTISVRTLPLTRSAAPFSSFFKLSEGQAGGPDTPVESDPYAQ